MHIFPSTKDHMVVAKDEQESIVNREKKSYQIISKLRACLAAWPSVPVQLRSYPKEITPSEMLRLICSPRVGTHVRHGWLSSCRRWTRPEAVGARTSLMSAAHASCRADKAVSALFTAPLRSRWWGFIPVGCS